MAGFELRADYDGIGRMLTSQAMQAEMRRRAEKVMQAAQQDAPVGGADDPHAGRYKDSFHVDSGVRRGRTARAFGRVSNTAPEAFYIEYGSRTITARHTLLRALDHAKD